MSSCLYLRYSEQAPRETVSDGSMVDSRSLAAKTDDGSLTPSFLLSDFDTSTPSSIIQNPLHSSRSSDLWPGTDVPPLAAVTNVHTPAKPALRASKPLSVYEILPPRKTAAQSSKQKQPAKQSPQAKIAKQSSNELLAIEEGRPSKSSGPTSAVDARLSRKKAPKLHPAAVYRVDRAMRKKMGTLVMKQVNLIEQKRTYFTHYIIFCQVLTMVVSLAVYGIAPISLKPQVKTADVVQPDGSIATVSHTVRSTLSCQNLFR
eukprot:m.677296 g.677296  ORF g.677296 m.677296 type:complete len:260 (+) comp58572_c0_seq1:363-1142(+)